MEIGYNLVDVDGNFKMGITKNFESVEEAREYFEFLGWAEIDVLEMKSKERKERTRKIKTYKVACLATDNNERIISEVRAYNMTEAKEDIEADGYKVLVIATPDSFNDKLAKYVLR